MALVLLVTGLWLLIAGVRGSEQQAIALLKSDFTGPNSFVPWVTAVVLIGAVGYFDDMAGLSDGFLALLLVVLLLSNGGFFEQFFRDVGVPSKVG